jgi:hypothetical protein
MASGGASPTLVNCSFVGNSAAHTAGAMLIEPPESPVLINCTFAGNRSSGYSGAIFCGDGCDPVLTNCILWANTQEKGDIEHAQINSGMLNYCCVQGWSPELRGIGNFGEDPMFVDLDGPDNEIGTEDDDLRLNPNSPCIDSGDSTALPADVTDLDADGDTTEPIPFDIEGHPRVRGGTVEVGAYECE